MVTTIGMSASAAAAGAARRQFRRTATHYGTRREPDSVNGRLRRDGFEPSPARGEEPCSLQPIEHTMVEREAEVHHRLDPDQAVDGDWPLDDRLHGQDAGLAGVDDRVAEKGAEGARVVDGERRARKLIGLELLAARAGREVVDRPGEASDG